MFKNPLVIGVNQVERSELAKSVESTLASLGQNSGNMMFTESLCRVLGNERASSFAVRSSDTQGKDAIVIAAANWVNEFDDFGWLANVIEHVHLPVFLVGVGAQSSLEMEIPRVPAGTLRFLKIVAERSKSIAARGQFSCDVLRHYGFKNVVPTGCPSLLLAGTNGPRFEKSANQQNVVLHATRHGFGDCDKFQKFLYRQAFHRNMDILLQSEHADIYLALGQAGDGDILAKSRAAMRNVYGTDDDKVLDDYIVKHGLFYSDFATWISEMKKRSFCLGTRIHGTVASLIAGTPAVLIAHDSRTLEMAKTMNIPYVLSSAVPTDADLDLAKYMTEEKLSSLVGGYAAYRKQYVEYFVDNGLPYRDAVLNPLA